MNINLIVGTFYPAVSYGGPIFSTLYTGRELARLGNKVYVSTTNANGEENLNITTNKFIQYETNLFVKYYGGANYRAFSWPLIFNIWKDIKRCDIVSLQGMFSCYIVVSLWYASVFKKPVLLSPRGSLGDWCIQNKRSTLKKIWLMCFVYPFLKIIRFHATSEQEKYDIKKIFPKSDVIVIPNGIDPTDYTSSAQLSSVEFTQRFIGKPIDGCIKIISMGRLHCKKGFDILIKAFAIIKKEYPEAVLLIAGPDGGEYKNLQQQVRESKLEDHVFFVGELSGHDKVDFLTNGDIFVLPSHHENFGNVYAESLAAGTPIIASTNTPWQDVEKNSCGKWVNNSVEETAIAMKEMLGNDLIKMGCCGRKYINTFFTWPSIALQFGQTFENMVNKS